MIRNSDNTIENYVIVILYKEIIGFNTLVYSECTSLHMYA